MLIVRNNLEFAVSIAQNTNRIVSSSNDNLGGTKNGTFIKLGEDDVLYSIIKSNRFLYNKKFETNSSRTIRIQGDTGVNLQPNDIIRINYDEYELFDVLEIKNNGRGYNPDNVITINGGELSIDIADGIGHPTKLKIEEVNINGEVEKISILQRGKYIIPPKTPFTYNSEYGENFEVDLKYYPIDNKSIITRVIKTISFDTSNNQTIIDLDYSLPLGITKGNLSVEKWEVLLDRDYKNETKFGLKYRLFKDFTLNYKFPLISKNSNCIETLLNKTFIESDKIIKNLENRIIELEKKINNN